MLREMKPNDGHNTEFLKFAVLKRKKSMNMLTLKKKASLPQLLLHLKINLEKNTTHSINK